MWGGSEEKESIETIRAALDQGVTVADKAPVYGFGRSEEIVGKALATSGLRSRGHRPQGRPGMARPEGVPRREPRAHHARGRGSLRRLRTDYIDIYQVHWPDPLVSMEETAAAMRSLYEPGKIRAIGVNNFSVAQMDAFRRVAPRHVLQSPYNLFERGIEDEILPYCRRNNIAVLGYGRSVAECAPAGCGRTRPSASRRRTAAEFTRAIPLLRQACHPSRGALDAGPGCHGRVVGRSPSRPACP